MHWLDEVLQKSHERFLKQPQWLQERIRSDDKARQANADELYQERVDMSDEVKMRTIVMPYSNERIEIPDDEFNYFIYRVDGHLLIYRSEVTEDGGQSEKFLWEKRKCD